MPPRNRTVDAKLASALDRLASAERDFLRHEFLAPVLRGSGVQVRIAGVRCALHVEPSDFQGWGVFRPESHALARLARPARMNERRRYLGLFPAVSLVLCYATGEDDAARTWFGVPAQQSDARFRIEGFIPVRLAEDVEPFDTVRARFDGAQFWFDEMDPRAHPGAAAYLRQCFAEGRDPARVDRPGLTAEHRRAYLLERLRRVEQAAADVRRREFDARQSAEERLRDALAHAGAQFRGFAERGDVYRVTYTVDGRPHTSVVNKHDLSVQTAGICLSGGDRGFDLGSLVGVIREGTGAGRIVRVPS